MNAIQPLSDRPRGAEAETPTASGPEQFDPTATRHCPLGAAGVALRAVLDGCGVLGGRSDGRRERWRSLARDRRAGAAFDRDPVTTGALGVRTDTRRGDTPVEAASSCRMPLGASARGRAAMVGRDPYRASAFRAGWAVE
jgi:hypothetical protein